MSSLPRSPSAPGHTHVFRGKCVEVSDLRTDSRLHELFREAIFTCREGLRFKTNPRASSHSFLSWFLGRLSWMSKWVLPIPSSPLLSLRVAPARTLQRNLVQQPSVYFLSEALFQPLYPSLPACGAGQDSQEIGCPRSSSQRMTGGGWNISTPGTSPLRWNYLGGACSQSPLEFPNRSKQAQLSMVILAWWHTPYWIPFFFLPFFLSPSFLSFSISLPIPFPVFPGIIS